MDQINLEGAYEQIKQEMPRPHKANCTDCGRKLITQIDVSYMPDKDQRIKFFRPAFCKECMQANGIFVKLIAEIDENGELHPKNKEGRVE